MSNFPEKEHYRAQLREIDINGDPVNEGTTYCRSVMAFNEIEAKEEIRKDLISSRYEIIDFGGPLDSRLGDA